VTGLGGLVGAVRELARRAQAAAAGGPAEAPLAEVARRLDEPLRVAIAGKLKAGKSTLLNALVGEELAPTDAGECTRIVTWYREGVTYRVTLEPRDGAPVEVPFSRDGGAIDVDLGGRDAAGIDRLVVEWPSSALRVVTLIDTPGLESLSEDVSARARRFLTPDDERPTQADAVLYLMRHLHTSDVRFLEAFHDDELSQSSPVNAIGVLSRADEIGAGRPDSLDSARRIAARYSSDPQLRRLCQTVVPVAGLIAQAGTTLREAEFRAIATIAEAPQADADALLLSVDRFANADTPIRLTPEERQVLLDRFGIFGVRLAAGLIRYGLVDNASRLAAELVARSGLNELRTLLSAMFSARADLLKARSALIAIEAAVHAGHLSSADQIARDVERVFASAHEFAEIRVLNALRSGTLKLGEAELADAERLLGAGGAHPAVRLGLPGASGPDEIRAAAYEQIARWQQRAENPLSSREVSDAARVLVRTCEGIVAGLG
jgi:GTPase SAR1 family protein